MSPSTWGKGAGKAPWNAEPSPGKQNPNSKRGTYGGGFGSPQNQQQSYKANLPPAGPSKSTQRGQPNWLEDHNGGILGTMQFEDMDLEDW